jgi:hypothetical protein
MDLTGASQSATGIQQVVMTDAGATYNLVFHVGNVVNPAGNLGTSSSVEVFADERSLGVFTNSDGGTTQNWREFRLSFPATNALTRIAFVNRDPPNDSANGLDNVVLTIRSARPRAEPARE